MKTGPIKKYKVEFIIIDEADSGDTAKSIQRFFATHVLPNRLIDYECYGVKVSEIKEKK